MVCVCVCVCVCVHACMCVCVCVRVCACVYSQQTGPRSNDNLEAMTTQAHLVPALWFLYTILRNRKPGLLKEVDFRAGQKNYKRSLECKVCARK